MLLALLTAGTVTCIDPASFGAHPDDGKPDTEGLQKAIDAASSKPDTAVCLAKGVYESLVNTTIGLFISIVFLSAYFFMKNKVSDILLEINNSIGEILARHLSPEAERN